MTGEENVWGHNADKVTALLADGSLLLQRGAGRGATRQMARARQLLTSAQSMLDMADPDPTTAFTVAYDAAKHAGLALLGAQELRPGNGPSGGHVAIEVTLLAQFAGVFDGYNALRRRRNDLDYPTSDDDFSDQEEAARAIVRAEDIVNSAQRLLDGGLLHPWPESMTPRRPR